jgi:TnpA family transposase
VEPIRIRQGAYFNNRIEHAHRAIKRPVRPMQRMAAASKGVSPQEITWKRIFHTRPETYKLGQACITDTGSASNHVFGLFALTGLGFAPRPRNLKDRKLHTFEKLDAYPALQEHIGGSCPVAWCKGASPRLSRVAGAVTADSRQPGSSLNALRLSSDR